ncbi:metal-dependent hydrolase [Leptolyngbya sp. NK1-12]|uniref:Metal-dependent hydrolase n=1 Tax=Leptolyngbya sp. NK1-12 TaxID=2547451 RepID=A0AA97AQT7_9CYAN|nr:metal-dependent hydrolase [Leptolyngbya sp. NK1-12]WNZ24153.1 metal-dependent hydrolase [Leptolyngbya sp. NK1-12]
MMSLTHATIAAAGASLILGTANPLALGLAILGSQLPDLDTTTSTIGQICYPISSWIETRFPHRSITHSLLATLVLTLTSLFIGSLLNQVWTLLALPLGHLLACFSDTFTKQGVQLFYPYPAWAVSVSNPRRRLKTGGAGELWVLGGAIVTLMVGIYFATGGGITQQVSQVMGLKEGIFQSYNRHATSHHVYAEIKGVWASDRSRADGRYFILGTEGSEFVVTDGKGIYKTGQQLIAEHLSTSVGEPAITQSVTLNFADEEATAKLEELVSRYPGTLMSLTGSLVVDMPEAITLIPQPRQYQTASLTGSTLSLTHHPIEQALLQLKDQYAVGMLTVKIVQPRPIVLAARQ